MDPLIIVACADLVYQALGTGHSESVYHRAMEVELRARVIRFETKVILPISYRGLNVGYGEADLIVYTDDEPGGLIVELKATTYAPRASERAQLKSYLRARQSNHGVLINFRQPTATTPSPQNVDHEEMWMTPAIELAYDLPVADEGVVASSHSEKDTEGDDDQQHKTKGESC